MNVYAGLDYVGEDGYWYSVGQAAAAARLAAATPVPPPHAVATAYTSYDPTRDPNWVGARALVLSTVQSVLGDDSTFDRIARQVIQHLRRQGFIDARLAAQVSRPDFLTKTRAWVRQMLYYMDVNDLIDLVTKQLVRAARSVGKSPFA